MTNVWIIAAVSDNNVIGNGNALPWRIPEDLSRFKALTLGNTLIMGRKTFASIGKPLPGRTTLVLTRRVDFAVPGVLVAHDREEALSLVPGPNTFVAGGADIYALFLPLASKLFLTRVHGVYDGDTYFPPYDPREWSLVSSEPGAAAAATASLTFEVYERRNQHVRSSSRTISRRPPRSSRIRVGRIR
jgi:dihydrofolate reductase